MRLGVLFSGGKDSTLVLKMALEHEEVVCLITIESKNKESYMFHTPNIDITSLQAEAIGLPLVKVITLGKKELELKDLKKAIKKAKTEYGIEGIVTGAIESVYQAERVQRICNELKLWCFNPLWKKDQEELLKELVNSKFDVIISGVFAYPLSNEMLGRKIDARLISEMVHYREVYKISPSGEGGEIETTVLDAPFFKRRIAIINSERQADKNSGVFIIKKARLEKK